MTSSSQALGVSRSGYYKWRKQSETQGILPDPGERRNIYYTLSLIEDLMKLEAFAIVLIVAVALISNASAVYWSSSVITNSSSWYIYRESHTFIFESSGSVVGKIAPIDLHGRSLSPHLSYYAEIGANDIRLRTRTSALEGNYKSQDEMMIQSFAENDINITVIKPVGTEIYTISYYEQWPIILTASRTIDYSGQQINDRDFEGNNEDFVGASFLYNHELSKDQKSVMWLQRLNATVLSTNDTILLAEFKPTKYLGYMIRAASSGMADLTYKFGDPRYDLKHHTYPPISEGDERYYGTYNLSRKIEMRSNYENYEDEDDWLPCCYDGWDDMSYFDKKSFGFGTNELFDCTCSKITAEIPGL